MLFVILLCLSIILTILSFKDERLDGSFIQIIVIAISIVCFLFIISAWDEYYKIYKKIYLHKNKIKLMNLDIEIIRYNANNDENFIILIEKELKEKIMEEVDKIKKIKFE